MKKQENINFGIGFGQLSYDFIRIFVISFFFYAMLSLFVTGIFEPQFTITQEVCHNETIQREFNETLDIITFKELVKDEHLDTYRLCKLVLGEENCSRFYDTTVLIVDKWNNGEDLYYALYNSKEVCEDKEVEEIVGYKWNSLFLVEFQMKSVCEQLLKSSNIILEEDNCKIIDNNPFITGLWYKKINITKSDLSEEWLNENCDYESMSWICRDYKVVKQ